MLFLLGIHHFCPISGKSSFFFISVYHANRRKLGKTGQRIYKIPDRATFYSLYFLSLADKSINGSETFSATEVHQVYTFLCIEQL